MTDEERWREPFHVTVERLTAQDATYDAALRMAADTERAAIIDDALDRITAATIPIPGQPQPASKPAYVPYRGKP